MDFRDKRRELKKIRDGSKKVDGERLGAEKEARSSLVMLSAVYQQVQQIFSFAEGSCLANYTAEFGEHYYVTMFFRVH